MVAIVDVDYYIDMNAQLCEHFRPTVLYTMIPEKAAAVRHEYSYCFDDTGRVNYYVSGGGEYKHHLWDYGIDTVLCQTYSLRHGLIVAAYAVDRLRVADDHYLVQFTPIARWTGLGAFIARRSLSDSPLRKFQPLAGDYAKVTRLEKGTHTVSIANLNGFKAAEIDITTYAVLQQLQKSMTGGATLATCKTYVEDQMGAAILYGHLHSSIQTPGARVYPASAGVRRYQVGNYQDTEAKASMVAFMKPIIDAGYVPDECLTNDHASVQARVENVRSFKEPNEFVQRAIDEFAALLITEPSSGTPVEPSEVFDRQNRPTQRQTLLEGSMWLKPYRVIRAFMKKEAYQEPKPPRMISTINAKDKLDYSRYTYALADHVKRAPWYAFSRCPQDVAAAVADIASRPGTTHAVMTDLSKCDGRISPAAKALEHAIMLRYFGLEHTERLYQLWEAQFNLTATTRNGRHYFTGTARASGSPETSLCNTILNSFIAYLTWRRTRVCGVYLNPQQAYERLGLYGGDDGFTTNIDPKRYEKCAAEMGQVLTAERVEHGTLGLRFLARIYGPDVWQGDPNSMCDIARQLTKLHLTVRLDPRVTPAQKLLEKARNLLLSDPHTPIIGPLARAVVNAGITPADAKYVDPITPFYTGQYHNVYQDWMDDVVERDLGNYGNTKLLRNTADNFHSITIEDILDLPRLFDTPEPSPAPGLIVDGDLKGPKIPAKAMPKRGDVRKQAARAQGPDRRKFRRKSE